MMKIRKEVKLLSRFFKMKASTFCILSFCMYFVSFFIFLCLGIEKLPTCFNIILMKIDIGIFFLGALFSGVSIYKVINRFSNN